MALTEFAKNYHEKMLPGWESTLQKTDPEFISRFDNFAFDEVINHPAVQLSDKTRFISHLAVLLGCQGVDNFKIMLPAALNMGVTPVEAKEIVYQAVAYLGMGRVQPFIAATNEVFAKQGISLPLESQETTTMEDRLEKGNRVQADIFGEGMLESWKSGPQESAHINYWLADNCFGDYYTRTGLDVKTRELITFCYLYAQGGCEPQLLAHTKANFGVGNDKELLIKIISANIPQIGYPRTLNALRIINEAAAG
ncbi:MAG: carboxymuconolactone decarboxylase family protein [Acutalibacter sp.]|nr:carboxymuconolactone decarboxylase family protein [Acutalibacter sp.]